MVKQTKNNTAGIDSTISHVLRHAFLTSIAVMGIAVATPAMAKVEADVGGNLTDLTDSVIETVVASAQTPFASGAYTQQGWDSAAHAYTETPDVTGTATAAGDKPTADTQMFILADGSHNLASYCDGNCDITDPTADAPAYSIVDNKIDDYKYAKKNADGSLSDVALTATDMDSTALSKAGYDYETTAAHRADGMSSINIDTKPTYDDYVFDIIDPTDGSTIATKSLKDYMDDGDNLNLPKELLDNVATVANAGAALNAYAADTNKYTEVNGYYNESNNSYLAKIADVNNDQTALDNAIEAYRNKLGEYNAANTTYDNYTAANANAAEYENSLASVIASQAKTAADDAIDGAIDASLAEGGALNTALAEKASVEDVEANTAKIDTNTQAIANNKTAIESEASRAEAAESELSTKIDTNTTAIAANKTAIESEASRAEAAESELSTKIDTNTQAIANNKTAIESEVARATAAEAELSDRITANETAIDKNTEDIATNTAAIAENRDAIAANAAAIEAETTRATAAEEQLANDITAGDEQTLAAAKAYADNQNYLTLKSANDYTDQKVNTLEKNVSGGIAAATALSGVSVANVNKGEVSVGAGYGYYNSQSAFAFGATMGVANNWSVNAGASIATGDKAQVAFRAGTNYKFKLF